MAFLCKKHYSQLSKNPIMALSYWQKWIEAGNQHMRSNELNASLQYFGCAFETSELLLKHRCSFIETQLKRIDRFMLSGFYLSEIYKRKNKRDIEGRLLTYIYNCLETFSKQDDLLAKRLRNNIEFSKLMIEKFNKRSDELLKQQDKKVFHFGSGAFSKKGLSIH